jgi:hypothetical protein
MIRIKFSIFTVLVAVFVFSGMGLITNNYVKASNSVEVLNIDFESGLAGFENSGTTPILMNSDDNEGCAYDGKGSMKVSGIWARKWTSGNWIQSGNFFELSTYAKKASVGDCQAVAEMYIWGSNADGNDWVMGNTRVRALYYTNLTDEFTKMSGIFGIYSDGKTTYVYHDNKKLEVFSELANKIITNQSLIDFGVTSNCSAYFDSIVIKQTTEKKDIKLSLLNGDTGLGVSGATIKVLNGDGTELAVQPVIEDNNGVYSIKDLEFSSFTQKYKISAEKAGVNYGTKEIDFINSEISLATEFTGTVTVKDEQGNYISNAKISYDDVEITANENGVYSVSGLLSSVTIKIACEGKLSKTGVISPSEKEIMVVLKTMKQASEVTNNIYSEGNFENGFKASTNKQGVDMSLSTEEQYDGAYSLHCVATGSINRTLIRMPNMGNTDGTVYYLEVMAKAKTEGAVINLGYLYAAQMVSGSWGYPYAFKSYELTSEWTKYYISYSIRFDEVTRTAYYTINDGDVITMENVVSLQAIDLDIGLSANAEIYIDNIVLLETYTGKITVKDSLGNNIENAKFTMVDHNGKAEEITPEYVNGAYTFEELMGVVKIYTKVGETEYPAITLSKTNKLGTVEDGYTVTVILVDQNDKRISGANVILRKGIITIDTLTDNGNGTYTSSSIMGEASIIITIEGYTFEKNTVSASNSVITIKGTDDNYVAPIEQTPKKGCSSATSPISIIAILMVFLANVILFKNKTKV